MEIDPDVACFVDKALRPAGRRHTAPQPQLRLPPVFHLGNGLWTMGIAWGITASARSQRLSFWLCGGLTLLLAAMGLHGLIGFLP